MGSMQTIYKLEKWVIEEERESKINSEDTVCKVIIGYYQDEFTSGNIWEFISKDNYENLISGNFTHKVFPYSVQKILIFDKEGNVVTLVKDKPDDEYSFSQKEFIKSLKKR